MWNPRHKTNTSSPLLCAILVVPFSGKSFAFFCVGIVQHFLFDKIGFSVLQEYYDNGMTRAQLESAQETITQLESQLNTLKRQRSRESQMGREAQTARDLEKELNEVKDRNAALQSQLTEYAGVISDQSKVS